MKKYKSYLSLLAILFAFDCKKENSMRIENERESGSTISLRNFTRDAFNEKGIVKSKLTGDRAEIDQKAKTLLVNGNIDLITEDSRHLKAEKLIYDLKKETLNTDKPVTIIMKGTTIKGIGMEADKGLNKVKILKPAGVSSDNPLEKKILRFLLIFSFGMLKERISDIILFNFKVSLIVIYLFMNLIKQCRCHFPCL